MSSEIVSETHMLADALALAGQDEQLRESVFEALRAAELRAANPATFREQIRWPLILSLLRDVNGHRVVLESGVMFDVTPDSRIEKALLLSSVAHPDHVWEPQTTKLLVALAAGTSNVVVGGAYMGDQVLLIAKSSATMVHAFEPMQHAFDRLLHHIKINHIDNVSAHRFALWHSSNLDLRLEGHLALASAMPAQDKQQIPGELSKSLTIDDYVSSQHLGAVELIMLDTEGGEENALLGGRETIAQYHPNIVFEIHRNFVDWTNGLEKTSIVAFLTSQGYEVFAIRDFHNNYPMSGYPIEIIPVSQVYLEGPPHGFNVLATKDRELGNRLGLRVVKNVSPKLLLEKDPALHFPLTKFVEGT
ncbi:MAG TPA: FkbM family methyltransferase [Pyrinomonadaceae bacterium]|nr:FkbM family methyltransferase [Pyrinomonadaceae bacterium]